jgi:hypothetical protein
MTLVATRPTSITIVDRSRASRRLIALPAMRSIDRTLDNDACRTNAEGAPLRSACAEVQ